MRLIFIYVSEQYVLIVLKVEKVSLQRRCNAKYLNISVYIVGVNADDQDMKFY